MNKYELTVVMAGKATTAQKKSQTETIQKMVNVLEGKILETDDWGEKELAYEISKNKTGQFIHFVLELNQTAAKQLPEKIRLEENVIRNLFVLAENEEVVKSKKPKTKKKTTKVKKEK